MGTEYRDFPSRELIEKNRFWQAERRFGVLTFCELWLENSQVSSWTSSELPNSRDDEDPGVLVDADPARRTWKYRPVQPDGTPRDWSEIEGSAAVQPSQAEPEWRELPDDETLCRHRWWQSDTGVLYVFDRIDGVVFFDFPPYDRRPPIGSRRFDRRVNALPGLKWRPADKHRNPVPWDKVLTPVTPPPAKAPAPVEYCLLSREIVEAYPGQLWQRENLDASDSYLLSYINGRLHWRQNPGAENDEPMEWRGSPDKFRPMNADGTPIPWEKLTTKLAKQVVTAPKPDDDFRSGVPSTELVAKHHDLHGGYWELQIEDADEEFRYCKLWLDRGSYRVWFCNDANDTPEGGASLLVPDFDSSCRPVRRDGMAVPWSELESALAPTPIDRIRRELDAINKQPWRLPICFNPALATQPIAATQDTAPVPEAPKEHTMSQTVQNKSETPKSRNRRAIDAALFRSPVEWTLDQTHDFVIYLLNRDLEGLPEAERIAIQSWATKKLKSPYGKALLGIIAGNLAPLAATYLAHAETLVEQASDKMLEYAYTTAFKEVGTDLVKFIGKPGLRKLKEIYKGMTRGVERAEKARQLGAAAPAVDFGNMTVTQKEAQCRKQG